ncbi:hypothetical protein O6H91_22G047900 [Diphasiastrum complanatum]|uniref:Uncharacterized protein n=2 Tax=Diphasiastrum complanatum TaxID=34168 RepID=A0ACC2AH15_DIPCM|nr:hypothetical protein O6H91_22G047900 [Diphasiastrum complanatum]
MDTYRMIMDRVANAQKELHTRKPVGAAIRQQGSASSIIPDYANLFDRYPEVLSMLGSSSGYNQSPAGGYISPFADIFSTKAQNNPTSLFSLPTAFAATVPQGETIPEAVSYPPETQSNPFLQENPLLTADLMDLIRESYTKICQSFKFFGLKFNERQLEYLVNNLLQPAIETTLPRLEKLDPDAFTRCSPVLTEFLFLIKTVEMVVDCCKDSNWWIHALTRADGGMDFSFLSYELLKCISLVEIVYAHVTNSEQDYVLNLVSFTLEDEESVIQTMHKPGEPDVRNIDTRKLQVLCDEVIHTHTTVRGAGFIDKEKFPVAKILSARISQSGAGRIDQQNSSFTIQDYLWIPPEQLAWQKPLGQGAYGTVHEVQWLGNRFAGKLFQTADNESFKREAAILSTLQHCCIVQLWGCCIDDKLNTCTLLVDLMTQDLFDFMEERASAAPGRSPPISYLVAVSIMLHIAEGMRYLHKRGVMHRDLKAKNVLVEPFHPLPMSANDVGFVWVKVCDFGMAKTKLASSNFSSPHVGTNYWRAPEVFKDEALHKKYTKKADVYSFAMTCAEILTAKPPFNQILNKDLYRLITAEGMRPSLPSSCPRYLAAYLQRCWATDPSHRPPFSEICRMLRHLKGLLIRGGSDDDSLFSCATEIDLEEMAKHLGVEWCISECLKCGKVSREVIVRFLLKASTNEHFTSNPDLRKALVRIGNRLSNWRGSKHEFQQAIVLFRIGARLGSAEAQWKLGLFLELGLGAEKDEEEAVRLYLEEAAEQEHANAYVDLGRCFDCGRGVQLSDKMASFYWGRAVKHQIKTGKAIQCVTELIAIVANCSDQNLCEIAAVRLWELSIRCRVGREILAGPNNINITPMVAALADPNTLDIGKHMITLMLPNLAMEIDIGSSILKAGGLAALVNFLNTKGIQNYRWRSGIVTAFEKLFKTNTGAARTEAVESGIIPSLLACLRHDPEPAATLLIQCLQANTAKAWLSKHKDVVMAIFRVQSTAPGVSSMHATQMRKELSFLGFDMLY